MDKSFEEYQLSPTKPYPNFLHNLSTINTGTRSRAYSEPAHSPIKAALEAIHKERAELEKEILKNNQELTKLLENQKSSRDKLHQLEEERIKSLTKENKANEELDEKMIRINSELKKMQEDLHEMENRHKVLWAEHNQKEKRKKTLKRYEKKLNLYIYYNSIYFSLEAFFISCKAAAGGMTEVKKGHLSTMGEGVEILGEIISLAPFVGKVADILIKFFVKKTLDKIDETNQIRRARSYSQLMTITEIGNICDEVARKLTRWYSPQLRLIAEDYVSIDIKNSKDLIKTAKEALLRQQSIPPAKKMADFAFAWILKGLSDNANLEHNKLTISQQLVQFVTHKYNGAFKVNSETSATITEGLKTLQVMKEKLEKACSFATVPSLKGELMLIKNIYLLCGLKIKKKNQYYHSETTNVCKYGWANGNKSAAIARNLKLEKPPTEFFKTKNTELIIHKKLTHKPNKIKQGKLTTNEALNNDRKKLAELEHNLSAVQSKLNEAVEIIDNFKIALDKMSKTNTHLQLKVDFLTNQIEVGRMHNEINNSLQPKNSI